MISTEFGKANIFILNEIEYYFEQKEHLSDKKKIEIFIKNSLLTLSVSISQTTSSTAIESPTSVKKKKIKLFNKHT